MMGYIRHVGILDGFRRENISCRKKGYRLKIWEAIMKFFENLGKNFSSASSNLSGKAKNFAEIKQLNKEIENLEEDIDDWMQDIGEMVYRKMKDDTLPDPDLRQLIDNIDEAKLALAQKEAKKNELKGIVVCVCCGKEINAYSKFCPECGAKQPDLESKLSGQAEDKANLKQGVYSEQNIEKNEKLESSFSWDKVHADEDACPEDTMVTEAVKDVFSEGEMVTEAVNEFKKGVREFYEASDQEDVSEKNAILTSRDESDESTDAINLEEAEECTDGANLEESAEGMDQTKIAPSLEKEEEKEEPFLAEAFCPDCGHPFRIGTKYCSACGASLTFSEEKEEASKQ